MILTEKHYMRSIEGAGGLSEGIKFLAVVFLVVFLVDCLLVILGREGEREIPLKSYLAYMMVYFFYRISLI